jgi:hypothetical protein
MTHGRKGNVTTDAEGTEKISVEEQRSSGEGKSALGASPVRLLHYSSTALVSVFSVPPW